MQRFSATRCALGRRKRLVEPSKRCTTLDANRSRDCQERLPSKSRGADENRFGVAPRAAVRLALKLGQHCSLLSKLPSYESILASCFENTSRRFLGWKSAARLHIFFSSEFLLFMIFRRFLASYFDTASLFASSGNRAKTDLPKLKH